MLPGMVIAGISIHYLDLTLYQLLSLGGNLMVPKWIAGQVSSSMLSKAFVICLHLHFVSRSEPQPM